MNTQPLKPSRILFFPLGWILAHTLRCIEIAKVLRQRGHEVVFAGDDPTHPSSRLQLVKDAGFQLIYAREPDLPYAWERFQRLGWRASLWDLAHLRHWSPLTKLIESQIHAIETVDPDLIVADATVCTSTAAYITGRPVAGVMNGYAARLLTPPAPTYFAAWGYDRYLLAKIRRKLYHKLGLPDCDAFELLYRMPMISPDLPGLYPLPKRFHNYHMVGPIFPDMQAPLPDWFAELENKFETERENTRENKANNTLETETRDDTPNIYITMGSTGLLDPFLNAIYPEFAKLPYRFLVTTGGQASQATLDAAPDNFRLTRYAPGSKLLEHCQAMIYHGGNGSMYQALAAGVPMLALPAHYEQRLNARIGVQHGFGLRMPARHVRVKTLIRNLERLLNEPRFRQASETFSNAVQQSNGAANAADILENTLRQHH